VVDPQTDDPAGRFVPGSRMFLEDGTAMVVNRYEATDRSPVVTFEGVDSREHAEALRGRSLYIKADDRRLLGEDEFWPDEMIGLTVVDPTGAPVGTVSDVETGLSQDRLIVEGATGTFVVPLVAALVPEVDVLGGRVVVDLPPGFTDAITE
jgi:16S rRNA processing protein RimM